jgi:hypothetical protein
MKPEILQRLCQGIDLPSQIGHMETGWSLAI